jgi:uncharacterized membrane protein
MNWKLIFCLSLFGLAMAFATVFWIPTKIEPLFWLVIFAFCAYFIAKRCKRRYFLHGFLVSLVNTVWITAVQVILYPSYIATHPEMAKMSADMPMPNHPQLMMVLMGPVFGVLSGLVLGLFSFIAAKLVKKTL